MAVNVTAPVSAEPVTTPQYSRRAVLGIWAAAALPMAALAWIAAPALAGPSPTPRRFAEMLIAALLAGLVWQFLLVMILIQRERGDLSRSTLRDALWMRAPSTPTRRGGRLWLWILPFVAGFFALQLIPFGLPMVASHDFGAFLDSDAGQSTMRGNWALLGVLLVMFVFNTVLGEELLFRGLLLPRMRGAFGRADWIANGLLFGLYHLHQPWSIPGSVLAGLLMAYPSRRWRSAWMGIAIHSTQSVFLGVLLAILVLR